MPFSHYKYSIVPFIAILLIAACKGPGLFGSRNPHEQYAEKLRSSGLAEQAMGKAWLQAAGESLARPLSVTLPYKEAGYFSATETRAVCYRLSVQQGQKLTIQLSKRPAAGAALFTELLEPADDGTNPQVAALPDSNGYIAYEAEESGDLFLRLQPELLVAVSYELSISAGPSLAFPVSGGHASDVGSVWGDDRDAGRRKHQGIDIFGKKRTPLVAVADGVVHRVEETRLGGKVLWLRPEGRNIQVYYTHLEEQLAQNGQSVQTGDTLGLMGNTGNAKTTPPHLHFGIYGRGGAIDPLPFVKPATAKAPAIAGSASSLGTAMRTTGRQKLVTGAAGIDLESNTYVTLNAAMGGQYLVSLPDGTPGFLPVNAIKNLTAITKVKLTPGQQLLDKPIPGAPIVASIGTNPFADVLAVSGDYLFVSTGSNKGWVLKQD